jgi:Na+/H+ antiporter NhaC
VQLRLRITVVVLGFAVLVLALPSTDVARGSAWSLLPPLVAITLALMVREVIASLVVGVWLGTTMLADGNPLAGFLRVADTSVRNALTDSDHVSIIVFSMLLGGMVGVMSRSGGTQGVVKSLERLVTTPRRAQVATWLMGILIFFDDYSNTLIVGNAMRPVTDRHLVSREKLAYLVDSTAAPVACVAVVSSWIGYQVSLLGDALAASNSEINPISLFIASLPYAFYPLFALSITFLVAVTRRDWGPMYRAERRAQTGQLLAETAQPLADYESSGLTPDESAPSRWWNAAIPVFSVIISTLVGLYVSGLQNLDRSGAGTTSLREVIDASDPFTVLLWASLIGVACAVMLAVVQGILGLRTALEAVVGGFKSMLPAVVVLVLAWSLGEVCQELATADFLVRVVGPAVPPGALPAAVFLVAATVSFATGTSWGTMAILTPLAVPLALHSPAAAPHLLAATVSAILGGSVFGDHCSPISDTTIMSSMASSCDHVDHVRTQLPYALLGAIVAVAVGYIPGAALGIPAGVLLLAGLVVVVGWTMIVGRPVDAEAVDLRK